MSECNPVMFVSQKCNKFDWDLRKVQAYMLEGQFVSSRKTFFNPPISRLRSATLILKKVFYAIIYLHLVYDLIRIHLCKKFNFQTLHIQVAIENMILSIEYKVLKQKNICMTNSTQVCFIILVTILFYNILFFTASIEQLVFFIFF